MLAQEQDVIMRKGGLAKEVEGEFGLGGETQGTLVLTNRRLVFVTTSETEEDLPEPEPFNPWAKVVLYYSDVDDLGTVPEDARNTFIPISSVSAVVGHKGEVARPRLEVKWSDRGDERSAVFTEELTGSRKRNLNDWAAVIQRLRAGTQKLVALPSAPAAETLEGKVMRLLSDMQEKGVMTIEGGLRETFEMDVNPDQVQDACDRMASQGLLERYPDESGDVFYRKRSPLGKDDLSG